MNRPGIDPLERTDTEPADRAGDPAAREISSEEDIVVVPKGFERTRVLVDVVRKKTSPIENASCAFEDLNRLKKGGFRDVLVHMRNDWGSWRSADETPSGEADGMVRESTGCRDEFVDQLGRVFDIVVDGDDGGLGIRFDSERGQKLHGGSLVGSGPGIDARKADASDIAIEPIPRQPKVDGVGLPCLPKQ
jgi:hypothetical protein